ncbi:MAG: methyl-accepting chemotaxis protein [Hydrogenovibrio sp.]|uniref:methyl-accepting chemotaxis protein n=1 Tax=Hydrogenovibrio sp. TaxID=2065821 RepID=UPI002870278D|nr:methyl-accepting chemotaxis protein [Hydrogenovibrio sp.]MDR9499414.1 methyl-accepting chemotaxis protein [Hydrogenovibrio sp.]
MIDRLSIRQRLWANLGLFILMFAGTFGLSYLMTQTTQQQSSQLAHKEQTQTAEITRFQEGFMNTIQAMNHYLLSLSNEQNKVFNERVDRQIDALSNRLQALGAEIETNSSGFIEFTHLPEKNRAMLEQLYPLNAVLINLKKATNSYVFLKKSIRDTIEFGLERSAADLKQALTDFRQQGQVDAQTLAQLEQIENRMNRSQLMAAKMIATQDMALWQQFENKGLGTDLQPLLDQLQAAQPAENETETQYGGLFGDVSEDEENATPITRLIESRNQYVDAFADLKDFMKTTQDNNQSLAALTQEGNGILTQIIHDLQGQRIAQLKQFSQQAQDNAQTLTWASLTGSLILIALTFWIIRSIVGPLQIMRRQVADVARHGNFGRWKVLKGRNELVEMSQSVKSLFDELQQALNEIRKVSDAQANGQLGTTIDGQYRGDLNALTQSFNQSARQISHTFNDIETLALALKRGQFSNNMPAQTYQGQYQDVVDGLTQAMQGQANAINAVRNVTHAMREGDFSQRITATMPGDLANLQRYLNESLDNLETAINAKTQALLAFSQGNFSHNIEGQFKGKLLELKEHISTMAMNISTMLGDVREASSHAVHGVKEISSGNQDLNQRVQSQAALIEKTASQMGLITQHIDTSLQHSQRVNSATQTVKADAQSGMQTVSQMVDAMERIQQASQEVAGMTEMIDSIAFQTNLLALNAAVEAARAGEEGRGFAVVAGEVRSLAQRSADAAQSIKSVTESNLQSIEQGMALSQTTLKAFEHNTHHIEQIADMANQMTDSLSAQTHGISEVSEALDDIDESTQKNAALVEEVATTSDTIIEQVLALETKVQDFQLPQALNDASYRQTPLKALPASN